MKYIVYTEIIGKTIERWFYGKYSSEEKANEIALKLRNEYPTFHCVIEEDKIDGYNIKNIPVKE